LLGAMPGHLRGVGLAAKVISFYPENHRLGLPAHHGVIVLFDESDGTPLAVMEAGHLTAMRTAAATAISVRELAHDRSAVLAILGAGAQAEAHLAVVPAVRAFEEIRIAARSVDNAERLASEHPGLTVTASLRAAVLDADVVCCCTSSSEPVVTFESLTPGAHVTSVGGGAELDSETIRRGRVFVEWRGAVTAPFPAGAPELRDLDPDEVTELGEILTGRRAGRGAGHELTVFKSTGHAAEDIAAARLVYESAQAARRGRVVSLD
jgi:ornithine cyclodeaminase/alanine dehydrogenase-like protein (mu-crystallin family)